MGRKRNHPNPLSEVDAHACHAVMCAIVQRNGWTVTEVQNFLSDFVNREIFVEIAKSDFEFCDFYPDWKTIKSSAFQAIKPGDWLLWTYFLFLKEDYGNELRDKQIGEQLRRRETEVRSLTSLLGHGDNVDVEVVKSLSGSYELYRPFHLDPANKIMISRFEIGGESREFNCRLYDGYPTRMGKPNEDVFEGKIVPHGRKMMAVLSAPSEFESAVILHFDDVAANLKNHSVWSMSGIVLTAVGGGPASAWPIYASRIDPSDDFTPSVIDASEYRNLAAPVQEALDRGAVHWHYKHFPKPYSNLGPK